MDKRLVTSYPRASLAVGPGLKILRDRPKARKSAPNNIQDFYSGEHLAIHA